MNSPHNITPEEWDLIETWLDNKDFPGEAPLLKKKLTTISNVFQKIDYVKKVREEIEDNIRYSKIREFHNSISNDEKDSDIKTITSKKIKSNAVWYAIAATLAVLFGVFWMMDHSKASDRIFAKNFKPDIGLPLKMSETNRYGFYEGMLDYKQENYKEAIEKWQILWLINPENDTLNYFLGVANLAEGNAIQASEYLQNQERFQHGIFKEDAAWYAALAKIKKGKFKEAKAFLESNPSVRNKRLMNELGKKQNYWPR